MKAMTRRERVVATLNRVNLVAGVGEPKNQDLAEALIILGYQHAHRVVSVVRWLALHEPRRVHGRIPIQPAPRSCHVTRLRLLGVPGPGLAAAVGGLHAPQIAGVILAVS